MNRHPSSLRVADARLTTGVRLHYTEQGHPKAQAIILLHGYTDSSFSFSRVLPLLPPSYRVYVPDQRGHGDSERPASGYEIKDLAADVLAFMDAMRLSRATLVGYSMGSLVAQEIALAAPSRVARLVLLGSGTTLRNEEIFKLQRAVETLDDPVPARFAWEFQISTIHHPVPDDFLDAAVAESLKLPARVWRDALAGQLAVDYAAQLGRIQIPTLILQGDHDKVFTREAQSALVAGLPKAVFKVYVKTGHALHWERPTEFVHDLEDFIARTEPQLMPRVA